jgi:AcrR family transcriptional regulator
MKNDFKGTKKKIFDTALTLFAEQGYKATTMRQIAKKVGIQQSAIYNHFKNKEAILDTAIDRLSHSNLINIFEDKEPKDLYKKGRLLLKNISNMFKPISYDTKTDLLFRFMMQELFNNERLREFYNEEFYQKNVKKLSAIFFMMMQEEMIVSTDPLLLANEFFSPLFFYQLQIVRLKADQKSTSATATLFEKHVEFFWDRVKFKDQQLNLF